MQPSLILAICALLLMGAADAVSRRARQAGVAVSMYMLMQCPFFLITAVAASALLTGFDLSWAAWGYASLSALLAFSATMLLLKSLRRGEASVNVVVFRMGFVFSTMAALLVFDEPARPAKCVGLLLAACAIGVLAHGIPRNHGGARASLTDAVAAMALAAFMQFVWAWATKSGVRPTSFLFAQSVAYLVLAGLYAWLVERSRLSREVLLYAPINGVLTACGTLAALAAMVKGEVSVTLPIAQMSFVVTALLSIAFLREKMTMSKAVGGLLAVGAVILLGLR